MHRFRLMGLYVAFIAVGMALLATGDSEKARATWLYVRKQWPDFEPTARALDTYFGQTVREH